MSLATKWRPMEFAEVCSQQSIIKILSRQLEQNQIKNAYLFCGPSGCGKTSIARIFANKVNKGLGAPIEIDAASNNGVDNVKEIVRTASERSVNSEYKIYLVDECHSLTNQAWQAFLKCIEEPPKYTIFLFCTTDPQKVPATIVNRCMRFNLQRIPSSKIKERLQLICENEHFTNYEETIDYISKISRGQMRDAIANLEKVADYNTTFSITDTLNILGGSSYDIYFDLINAIIDGDQIRVLFLFEEVYNTGADLKLFVENFLTFLLDVMKYNIFRKCDILQIPQNYEDKLMRSINFNNSQKYYLYILNEILDLKNRLKQDLNMKNTIEVKLLKITNCQ